LEVVKGREKQPYLYQKYQYLMKANAFEIFTAYDNDVKNRLLIIVLSNFDKILRNILTGSNFS